MSIQLTPGVLRFLEGEIANERNGGESPATLATAVDSLVQGGADVFGFANEDEVCFNALIMQYGPVSGQKKLLELLEEADPAVHELVWVLRIEHEYDETVSVFRTQELAMASVEAYVDDWWANEMAGDPKPPTREEKIDAYFDNVSGECYSITSCAVVEEKQHIIPEAEEIGDLVAEPRPPVCIITGDDGEDADDCTTHDHEGN